uniref:hypothetical protein n=1 Tax=Candidatus Scatousia sp. TaxID=3085663 RepID=UPI0040292E08
MASAIYEGNPTIGAYNDVGNLTYKPGTATSLGLPEPRLYLWSGEEFTSYNACYRYFYPTYSYWHNYGHNRGYSNVQAVCLGD